MQCTEDNVKFQQAINLSGRLNISVPKVERNKILRELITFGEDTEIRPPIHIDFGNTTIGNNCFINCGCTFVDYGEITIGNNVAISFNCTLIADDHPGNPMLYDTWIDLPVPITIEDDVWIGAGVTILGGVTIGKGAIIGAGSVVTHNVPSGEVWAGNPARYMTTVEEYMKQYNVTKHLDKKGGQ